LKLQQEEVAMAKKAKKKMRRDAVSPFRDKLWNLFKEQASGMDGADVVLALKQAGEEIWAVGIDDTYTIDKVAVRRRAIDRRLRGVEIFPEMEARAILSLPGGNGLDAEDSAEVKSSEH
jgi:hypothetical protein